MRQNCIARRSMALRRMTRPYNEDMRQVQCRPMVEKPLAVKQLGE
jgi:hypothetical protein